MSFQRPTPSMTMSSPFTDDSPFDDDSNAPQRALRRSYQITAWGFRLLVIALSLVMVDSFLFLLVIIVDLPGLRPALIALLENPVWRWSMSVGILVGSVGGMLMMPNRWTQTSWNRKAIPLAFLGILDVLLWLQDHAGVLGIEPLLPQDYAWSLSQFGAFSGWIELALIAGLALEVVEHHHAEPGSTDRWDTEAQAQLALLPVEDWIAGYRLVGGPSALGASRLPWGLAVLGLGLWLVLFVGRVDWNAGFPFQPRPIRDEVLILIFLAQSLLLLLIASFVNLLCVAAARRCNFEIDRTAPSQLHSSSLEKVEVQDLAKPRNDSFSSFAPLG